MPDKNGRYPPSGKWIHDRAHRIMAESDVESRYGAEKGKSVAYALATQQAHATGKSPKKFRTAAGVREAKAKHDEPKNMRKTAGEMLLDRLSQSSGMMSEPAPPESPPPGTIETEYEAPTDGEPMTPGIMDKTGSATDPSGIDGRTSTVGSAARPPTEGSKTFAKQQLSQSQRLGDVGPSPAFNKTNKTGVNSMSSQTVNVPVPKGFKLKLAAGMEQDPLIRYVTQTPEGQADVAKLASALEDNSGTVFMSDRPKPMHSENPFPTEDAIERCDIDKNEVLKSLFKNYPGSKSKT